MAVRSKPRLSKWTGGPGCKVINALKLMVNARMGRVGLVCGTSHSFMAENQLFSVCVYVWRGEWACHANDFRWRKWSRKSLWLVAEALYWSRMSDTKNRFSKTRPAAGQNMAAICLISLLIHCSKQMCVCGGTTLISWNECLLSIDCIFALFISWSEIDSHHWPRIFFCFVFSSLKRLQWVFPTWRPTDCSC